MPSLQIRDLPPHLHRKLREAAAREHRTLSQQAAVLLAQALDSHPDPAHRRRMLIERLTEHPPVADVGRLAPPEELVREDRQR